MSASDTCSAIPLCQAQIRFASELQNMERQAVADLNLTMYELMQRAGNAAFTLAKQCWPHSQHWLILCGTGNNGGDGYVVALLAKQAGINVTLLTTDCHKSLPQPAQQAQQAWRAAGGEILPADIPWATDIDVIIDGLLGTGLNSAPRESVSRLIVRANHYHAPVLSLDIPSGLQADSGAVPAAVIFAQHTISFITLKPGLLTGQARDVTGTLHCNPLGLQDWLHQQPPARVTRYDQHYLRQWLPARRRCLHKGDNGRLLLIGGDQGMAGAICLAGQAALRAGAGLVRVLTREQHIAPLISTRPELMADELTARTLEDGLQWADALVIGPGLGQHAWGRQALQAVKNFRKPMLWDADALNLLAENPDQQQNRIITPHPGEAARLLNTTAEHISRNRWQAVDSLLARYGGGVLLKGAGSIVACNQQYGIIDAGNPGMATAGMGDILSGIIGGLLAQGLDTYQALCAGGMAHSAAADYCARQRGTRGMVALDLLNELYRFVNPEQLI